MTFLGIELKDWAVLIGIGMTLGGVMGIIVIWWVKERLSAIFASKSDVQGVSDKVQAVGATVTAIETRVDGLERSLAELPTTEDVRTIRHDVKDLLQGHASLASQVKGQNEMLAGIERRQEIMLERLMKGDA